jgi:hypothetical protein
MSIELVKEAQGKFADRTIIDAKLAGDNTLVVVARFGDNPLNPTPFVTWMYNRECKDFFWGHYFTTLESAVIDFGKRD